jgi:hypothetical protein
VPTKVEVILEPLTWAARRGVVSIMDRGREKKETNEGLSYSSQTAGDLSISLDRNKCFGRSFKAGRLPGAKP